MVVDEIIKKYMKAAKRIAQGIAYSENISNPEDLEGPALEGLWHGAEAVIAQGNNIKSVEAFLTVAIRNSILDFVRKEKHQGFTHVPDNEEIRLVSLDASLYDEDDEPMSDDVPSQDEDLTELRREIYEQTKRLPILYQPVFFLKLSDPSMSDQEIADTLFLTLAEVKHYIARGRKYFGS